MVHPESYEQRLQRDLTREKATHILSKRRTSQELCAAVSAGDHELLGATLWNLDLSGGAIAEDAVKALLDHSSVWQIASEYGHPQCLRLMLDKCKHSPELRIKLLEGSKTVGDTILMLAASTASTNNVECVRLLLEHSPEDQVRHVCNYGHSALMIASMGNNTASMKLLLEHSPKEQVLATCWLWETNALIKAAIQGHDGCVQLLLSHSPDEQVKAVDKEGENALIHAASKGRAACLRLLLAHSPTAQLAVVSAPYLSPDCRNALSAAASFVLEKTAACGGPADDANQSAARAGRECVELLLAHGARLFEGASAAVRDVVWSTIQDTVRLALVPNMIKAALAGRGRSKRPAEGQEEGAAAVVAAPRAPRNHA